MQRFTGLIETLNLVVQLLVGALLVALIDLWFIGKARAGYVTTPSWLVVAIPAGVTLLWVIGAGIALRVTMRQRGHSDTSENDTPYTG